MAESSGENKGQLNTQPEFTIPKEHLEGHEAASERNIEQRQVSESTPAKQTPKFPANQVIASVGSAQPIQNATTNRQMSSATSDLSAQDTDLIEKEWVERAKSIVAKTQNDPFGQKNEISKVKVDYIKKRFDKTIPLDDSAKS